MHEFKRKSNLFYCEDVKIQDLAKKFGTPLYVYSHDTFIGHFLKLKKAFAPVKPLICYSVKANSNLAILKALVEHGSGLDIVSGGELYRALKVGCPPQRIVYASVGKTDKEIEEAITKGILFFNVESLPELENIDRIARKLKKRTNVALRINPDVEAKTHKYITTGKLTNKFGIDFETATDILRIAGELNNVTIKGLHIHIGSQITIGEPFVEAIKKVVVFIHANRSKGVDIEYLNIGGGLGIIYEHEMPQTAAEFASKVLPILKASGLKIIMEPGRFIIGSAAILVTKVLYVKKTPLKKFVIVDAGMNDLIRPALYEAHHEIVPLVDQRRSCEKVDVVGPICESGDFLAKERMLPKVKEGEYLAAMCAGAYGFSMSSNYNSRRRAAEVLVKGNKVAMIRKREGFEDLIRNEIVPSKFK
jgi:diaminopimelate decarboxylase